ncbi:MULTISPECIES: YitT family protein [Lactobacillaceae]|uniref:YitT family protein n=1 Tax=Lactobacillaceae TaxID=33958 RepID=UPI000C1B7B8D|nr:MULTISPECIES: YitT family protein [Lactobacillaceae]
MSKGKEYTRNVLIAVFYGITSALGIQLLLQPSMLYTGGVMGLAQLIVNLLQRFANINSEVYVWYALINIPLVILAWKRLGKKFTIFTILAVLSASLFILFIPLTPITKDPVLASIFGGILTGVGIGICFRYDFSTGGTDIIALFIQKTTGSTVGQISFGVNAVIILIAGIVFGWKPALYSIISIYVCNLVVDKMYIQQQKITAVIYSKHIDEISEELIKGINRGITMDHNLKGAYSGDQIGSITIVLTKYQLFFVKQTVTRIDPNAFINIQPTIGIMGKFNDN